MTTETETWKAVFITREGDRDEHTVEIPACLDEDNRNLLLCGVLFTVGWGPPQDGEDVVFERVGADV